jgi:transposase-like protein
MAGTSCYSITLDAQERQELQRRAAGYTLPYYQVVRAKMILYAAQGFSNEQIAQRLDTRREVVALWRKRFCHERMAGLEECRRPGRPRSFSP